MGKWLSTTTLSVDSEEVEKWLSTTARMIFFFVVSRYAAVNNDEGPEAVAFTSK